MARKKREKKARVAKLQWFAVLATTSCASYLILYTIATAEIHEREIVLDSTAGSNFAAAAINDTFYPPGTLLLACTEIYNLHKEGITSTVFENTFQSLIS